MKKAVFLFLSSILFNNAHAQISGEVIGGSPAPAGKYPWMVALLDSSFKDGTDAQFCGGTLIAERYVLTAAHCVFNNYDEKTNKPVAIDPKKYSIFHGSEALPFNSSLRHEVYGAVIHPSFDDYTLENDFALIKLKDPLPGPYAKTISSSEASFLTSAADGSVLGWGIASNYGAVLPVNLQEALIPLKTDAQCLNNIGRYFKPDTMLCAGRLAVLPPDYDDGADACYGDSGGPLIIDDTLGGFLQIGVVSWGLAGDCASKFYGVYADILSSENFVTSRPVIAPFLSSPPYVSEVTSESHLLTCNHEVFSGEPADSVSYKWYEAAYNFSIGDYIYTEIVSAVSKTYQATSSSEGKNLVCEVTASNPGGSISSKSDEYFVDYLPVFTPTPDPLATPGGGFGDETDFVGPVMESLGVSCKKKTCSAVVSITDRSGVLSVNAELSVKEKKPCKNDKSKLCTKTLNSFHQLNSTGTETWQFSFKHKKKNKGKINFTATDLFGNPSNLTVNF